MTVKFLLEIFIVTICFFGISSSAQAELQCLKASGEYILIKKSNETVEIAKDMARKEAKRVATEETGLLIKSYSVVQGFELTKDEITVIAAQKLYVKNETIKTEKFSNGDVKFVVTIEVEFDPDKVNLDEILNNREELERKAQEYRTLNEKYELQRNANEEFKREYARLQSADIRTSSEIEANRKATDNLYKKRKYLEDAYNFLINKKDYFKCIDICEKVLKLDSESESAYIYLMLCYGKLDNHNESMRAAENVVRINPKSSMADSAYLIIASGNAIIKKYPAALNAAKKLIAMNTDKMKLDGAYKIIASVSMMNGKYLEAIEAATKLLSLNPDENDLNMAYDIIGNGNFILGLENIEEKKYSEALKNFETSLEIKNKCTEVMDKIALDEIYAFISSCHFRLRNYSKALEYSTQALSFNPNNKLARIVHDNSFKLTRGKN